MTDTSRSRPFALVAAVVAFIAAACAAALAALVAAALSVQLVAVVGTVGTASSTVLDNHSSVSAPVAAGIYDLAVTPDRGINLSPGHSGTISFRFRPDSVAETLDLRAPDVITYTITLPEGLVPGALPTSPGNPALTATWTKSVESNVWTVTRTDTITDLTNYDIREQSFPVTATADLIGGSKVIGALDLPERFASTHSRMEVGVAAAEQVTAGIHEVDATPEGGEVFFAPGRAGTVSFRSHLDNGAESLDLRDADVITYTFTLPRGLTPGTLPARHDDQRLTTTWAKAERSGIWTVTRTDTIKQLAEYNILLQSFPVTATADLALATKVSAVVSLPARFASAQSGMDAEVNSVLVSALGAYDLEAKPNRGTDFTAGAAGSITFATLPSGTSAPERSAAGDTSTHTVILPKGLTVGTLPLDQVTSMREVRWTKSTKSNGTTIVIRTQTRLKEVAQEVGREVLTFPVTATPDVADGALVLVIFAPNTSMMSTNLSASIALTAKTVSA